MRRDGVIKTYFTNFNLYKHLLSIDEQRMIIKNLMYIYAKNTLSMINRQDISVLRNLLKNTIVNKDNRYNYYFYFFYFTLIFLSLIMENKINEAYIVNLSTYMHLLSVNEIFEEIKKVKAFIDNLRVTGYNEKNKKDSYKKAISTINNLSKLYFSKSAE